MRACLTPHWPEWGVFGPLAKARVAARRVNCAPYGGELTVRLWDRGTPNDAIIGVAPTNMDMWKVSATTAGVRRVGSASQLFTVSVNAGATGVWHTSSFSFDGLPK